MPQRRLEAERQHRQSKQVDSHNQPGEFNRAVKYEIVFGMVRVIEFFKTT
jgi:hypothetical protein